MKAPVDSADRGTSEQVRIRRASRLVRPPILLFTAFYLFFAAALLLPFASWMPNVLISLTVPPSLFNFLPSTHVLLLYFAGLAFVWLGYLLAWPLTGRTRAGIGIPQNPGSEIDTRPIQRNRQRSKIAYPAIPAAWRWVLALAALALIGQFALSGAIPLFDIKARWTLSAKLVAVASLSVAVAGTVVAYRGWRGRTWFVVSVIFAGLCLLGTRTTPLILVVAVIACTALYQSPRALRKTMLLGILAALLIMVSVGSITKTAIYDPSAAYSALKGIGLMQSDSLGTFYNLAVASSIVEVAGSAHGHMLIDTLLNLIPGTQTDYANYQLGALVGGRGAMDIGGTLIDRSVSLTTTFVGPPYADGGWTALIIFSLVIGGLWRRFEDAALRQPWFVGLFGYWVGIAFSGVYGGLYNTTFMSVTALCLVASHFATRDNSAMGRDLASGLRPVRQGVTRASG